MFRLLAPLCAVVLLVAASRAEAAAPAPICAPPHCTVYGERASLAFDAPGAHASRVRRGSLRVVVSGVPAGSRARVVVRGPRGVRRVLRRTTTIRRAPAGRWTIAAEPIAGEATTTYPRNGVTRVRLGSGARGRAV